MSEKEFDSSSIKYIEEIMPAGYTKQLQCDMARELQEVSNPSKYLEKLFEENVSCNFTIEQVEEKLKEYYIEKKQKKILILMN